MALAMGSAAEATAKTAAEVDETASYAEAPCLVAHCSAKAFIFLPLFVFFRSHYFSFSLFPSSPIYVVLMGLCFYPVGVFLSRGGVSFSRFI